MINYRLSAAVSLYYIMQTLVQTHIRFLHAAPAIFPFSLDASSLATVTRYDSALLTVPILCLFSSGILYFSEIKITRQTHSLSWFLEN